MKRAMRRGRLWLFLFGSGSSRRFRAHGGGSTAMQSVCENMKRMVLICDCEKRLFGAHRCRLWFWIRSMTLHFLSATENYVTDFRWDVPHKSYGCTIVCCVGAPRQSIPYWGYTVSNAHHPVVLVREAK